MSDRGEQARERRAILWGGAGLAAAAVIGLVFAPGVDLLWLVLLFFAVASVPQALIRSRRKKPRLQRRG
jgi:hypothetical protein